jgi:plastocyanin
MKKIAILILMLAGLMILGCAGAPPPTNQTNATPPPPTPVVKTPSFSITVPASGDIISTDAKTANVTLTMSTQNLVLKTPGGAAVKGQGYFQITVDNNAPQIITGKTYTVNDLSLGAHNIKVELFNNDRTAYFPAISKLVSFTVQAATPVEYVPQSYSVSINNNAFTPANLTVKVKDSVTWTNDGATPATATCSVDGKIVFDTKTIGPGKSATVTFTDPVVCEYYSQLFRAMKGTMTVVPNGVDSQ